MRCWSLAEQILAVLTPSKKAPGWEGAAVEIEGGLVAVYGPAVPDIFYFSFGAVVGGCSNSCYNGNLKIK